MVVVVAAGIVVNGTNILVVFRHLIEVVDCRDGVGF